MKKNVQALFHRFDFPSKDTPRWHGLVERWYQLDAAAFGLCELAVELGNTPRPEMVILASPGGCNETDFSFVRHGAAAPAKFVHTLPNVRGSVLLQMLNWQGPMLCVQDDPRTVESALAQAALIDGTVWVVGMLAPERLAFCLSVGGERGDFTMQTGCGGARAPALGWMRGCEKSSLDLPMGLQLCRGVE